MPYQILFPALLLSLTMLGFNLLGRWAAGCAGPQTEKIKENIP